MSPHTTQANRTTTRFPRVSGDEPDLGEVLRSVLEFSPRERG